MLWRFLVETVLKLDNFQPIQYTHYTKCNTFCLIIWLESAKFVENSLNAQTLFPTQTLKLQDASILIFNQKQLAAKRNLCAPGA